MASDLTRAVMTYRSDACPTYYDGCNCTVEALAHNIERAQMAEAECRRLQNRTERLLKACRSLHKRWKWLRDTTAADSEQAQAYIQQLNEALSAKFTPDTASREERDVFVLATYLTGMPSGDSGSVGIDHAFAALGTAREFVERREGAPLIWTEHSAHGPSWTAERPFRINDGPLLTNHYTIHRLTVECITDGNQREHDLVRGLRAARADVVLRLVDEVRATLARDAVRLAEELYTITTECDREVAIRRMAARLLPEEKP